MENPFPFIFDLLEATCVPSFSALSWKYSNVLLSSLLLLCSQISLLTKIRVFTFRALH